MATNKDKRCGWCLSSELYIDYHDSEWGVPCYEAKALFESLNLEGAQAGLSWITILNKRENYRRLFSNFDFNKIAKFNTAKIDKLVQNEGIVRHRQKIEAFVNNAQMVVAMEKRGESFVDFLWSFVDYKIIQNKHKSMATVRSSTEQSTAMSKGLKKAGFKFVGPTTCYAFMQASGMVNDHLISCPQHKQVSKLDKKTRQPSHWFAHQ